MAGIYGSVTEMLVSHLVVNLHQLSASYISLRNSDLSLYVEANFTADIN